MDSEPLEFENLKSLEAALSALVPRGDGLSRDRLMFLAGQESALAAARAPDQSGSAGARRMARRWQTVCIALGSLAAGVLIALVCRPARVVERVVEVRVPATAVPATSLARDNSPVEPAPLRSAAWPQLPSSTWGSSWSGASGSVPRAGGQANYSSLRELAMLPDFDRRYLAPRPDDTSELPASHPLTQREMFKQLLPNLADGDGTDSGPAAAPISDGERL